MSINNNAVRLITPAERRQIERETVDTLCATTLDEGQRNIAASVRAYGNSLFPPLPRKRLKVLELEQHRWIGFFHNVVHETMARSPEQARDAISGGRGNCCPLANRRGVEIVAQLLVGTDENGMELVPPEDTP